MSIQLEITIAISIVVAALTCVLFTLYPKPLPDASAAINAAYTRGLQAGLAARPRTYNPIDWQCK
jgi:hypothetical protein